MTEEIIVLHQHGVRASEIAKKVGKNRTSVNRFLRSRGLVPILKTRLTTCGADGCSEGIKAKGFCNTHYAYWRRNGEPLPASLRDRLMKRCVLETNGCLIWTGSRDGKGYGRVNKAGKQYGVHRISYELAKGEIPKGLELDHLCRMKLCINPDHLEPVTHAENIRRAAIPRDRSGRYIKNGVAAPVVAAIVERIAQAL